MTMPDKRDRREYSKKYNEKNADILKEKKHAYYIKNKKHVNERNAAYRKKHRKHLNELQRLYVINNKERIAEYNITYRVRHWAVQTRAAHKRGGCDVLISTNVLHEYAKTVTHCYWCGVEINWGANPGRVSANLPALDRVNNTNTLDHIWTGPEDKSEGAVMITCHKCGTTKQNRTHDEFLAYCKKIAETH